MPWKTASHAWLTSGSPRAARVADQLLPHRPSPSRHSAAAGGSSALGMALRVQWSNLIDTGEHLRVHHHLWWALSFAFEQREHRFRLHDGPVDGRRCVPGVPLLELAGPDDVWGPGHA